MKKIVLICNISKVTKDISDFLSKTYRVIMFQFGSDWDLFKDLDSIDFIIVYLGSTSKDHMIMADKMLNDFNKRTITKKPIVLIGTAEEKQNYSYYCSAKESLHLLRPLLMEQIVEALDSNLSSGKIAFDTASTAKIAPPVKEVEAVVPSSTKRKALLVDDNGMALRALKGLLEGTYDITLANSTMSALSAIEKEKPDFVLLDYEMPIHNGKRALEIIRSNPTTKDIPVFFLTAVTDKKKIQEVVSLHPQGYFLKKNVGPNLITSIEEYFTKHDT